MKLMMLTADPVTASMAENSGVERIFLDLEIINKEERQKGRNTLISHNSLDDVEKIKKSLKTADLLVRVNPYYENSQFEIDRAIDGGADIIMMPMITTAFQVEKLVEMVKGRAKVCPLLETAQSVARLNSILEVDGIDELYLGLNDMHISFNLNFMFELLSDGIIDYMSQKIQAQKIPFGFGGLARIGEGLLPAEFILGEHYRLGSTSVILSRTFRNEVGKARDFNFTEEIKKIRDREELIKTWTTHDFELNKQKVKSIVHSICSSIYAS